MLESSKPESSDAIRDTAVATETVVCVKRSRIHSFSTEGTLQEVPDRVAAIRIKKLIDLAKGNRNAAATALGIDRTTLYRLMRRFGL